GREPCIDETRDQLAQMVFQLRYVDRVNRLPTTEVAPPLVDLLLERYRVTWSLHRQASSGIGAADVAWLAGPGMESANQMPCRVEFTAFHCSRSSPSRARPWDVIR